MKIVIVLSLAAAAIHDVYDKNPTEEISERIGETLEEWTADDTPAEIELLLANVSRDDLEELLTDLNIELDSVFAHGADDCIRLSLEIQKALDAAPPDLRNDLLDRMLAHADGPTLQKMLAEANAADDALDYDEDAEDEE